LPRGAEIPEYRSSSFGWCYIDNPKVV